MTYEVNGINYSNMMITEEERAVVEAMRNGADVELWLEMDSEEEALEFVENFPYSSGERSYISDHTDSKKSKLLYAAHVGRMSVYTKKRS